MSATDFFTAEEDSAKYDEVCDIRKKKNRTNANVIESFSGLECPGKELHEWESHTKLYKEKFKKAKQCVQRRITTMKKFPARTAENRTSRRKHIYPIQVAYAYGQDCLKKFATKNDQKTFKDSVNSLIKKVSESQPNVQSYFGNSINTTISSRRNTIRNILNRTYYDPEIAELINKTRKIGYDSLNTTEQELFFSIVNEAFSRNTRFAANLENENENEGAADVEEKKELINIIKKEIKRRRKTKKKSMVSIQKNVNITNLDSLLQTNTFKITNDEKRREVIKRINEIVKMFQEKILIDEKLFILEDIYYGTFTMKTKLNQEMATKTATMPRTLKGVKQAGLTAKDLAKFEPYQRRIKLGNDIFTTHDKFRLKSLSLTDDILKKLKTGNSAIDSPLYSFYEKDLPKFILQETNKKIDSLSSPEREKLSSEKTELYNMIIKIGVLKLAYAEQETILDVNLAKQAKAQEMLLSPSIKAVPVLVERTKETLKQLKTEEATLQKNLLASYEANTIAISDMYKQVNKKYDNLYILKVPLEIMIERESVLLPDLLPPNTRGVKI
jgi:hypothetical protein